MSHCAAKKEGRFRPTLLNTAASLLVCALACFAISSIRLQNLTKGTPSLSKIHLQKPPNEAHAAVLKGRGDTFGRKLRAEHLLWLPDHPLCKLQLPEGSQLFPSEWSKSCPVLHWDGGTDGRTGSNTASKPGAAAEHGAGLHGMRCQAVSVVLVPQDSTPLPSKRKSV